MKQVFIILLLAILQSCFIILQSQKRSEELPNIDPNVFCFTSSENGDILYYTNGNDIIQYDPINRFVVSKIGIQVVSPVISIQEESNMFFLGTKSGKLLAISKGSGETITEIDHKSGSITALATTNEGNTLLCGCSNGMVFKHSITDINVFTEFDQHDEAITSIEVSNEKQLIAVSSGDGSITIFKDKTYELINKLSIEKSWVRKVAFNNIRNRLLCVGDNGKLYTWNITDLTKVRLIKENKESRNWLLSLDISKDGEIQCWGGLDNVVKIRTRFGTHQKKFKGPILKVRSIKDSSSQVYIVCCILGKGIEIAPLRDMKYKSLY